MWDRGAIFFYGTEGVKSAGRGWGVGGGGGYYHSLLDRRVGVKAKHFRQFSAHVNRCFMGLAHREAIHVISPRPDHLQFCIPRPNNSLHDDTGRWPASQTSLAFDPL